MDFNVDKESYLSETKEKKTTEINVAFANAISLPHAFDIPNSDTSATVNVQGGRETLIDFQWLAEYYDDILVDNSLSAIDVDVQDAVSKDIIKIPLDDFKILIKDIRNYGIECELNKRTKLGLINQATSIDSLLDITWDS